MNTMSLLASLCALTLAALMMASPAIARPIVAFLSRGKAFIEQRAALCSIIAAVLWCGWIGYTFTRDGRAPVPHWHDEQSYLLQARIFASGHLWMPPLAHPDFFDTFHVLVTPAYASKYPPGTALLYVPAMWLGGHWLLTQFVLAGLTFGHICYLGIRTAGAYIVPIAFAAGMTSGAYQMVALQVLSQGVITLAAALAWLIVVLDRAAPRRGAFLLMGLVGGWAVAVRPVDAVLLLGPPALVLCALRWQRVSLRSALGAAAVAAGAAMPWFFFILVMNRGITGAWLDTPWALYSRLYQPGEQLGFGHPELGHLPTTLPLVKQAFYEIFVKGAVAMHTPTSALLSWLGGHRWDSFRSIVASPTVLAAILLPMALVGFSRRALWPIAFSVLASITLYALYPFGGYQYYFALAPMIWIAAACGLRVVLERIAAPRRATVAAGCVVGLALLTLALQWRGLADPTLRTSSNNFPETFVFERKLAREVRAPAVVFIKYDLKVNFHDERVYNLDTANPLDAPIIRAHWLGRRNEELLRALLPNRPDTNVWVYDRATRKLIGLGTVAGALANAPEDPPTTTPSAPASDR